MRPASVLPRASKLAAAAVLFTVVLVPASSAGAATGLCLPLLGCSSQPAPPPPPPPGTVTSGPVDPIAGEPCGGEVPAGTWTCSFDDEFSGTALDRSSWTVQTTSQYGFHSGDECMVDSPQTLAVGGGTLNLTVDSLAAPFTCTDSQGDYTTSNVGASVYTTPFAQQYGRFEVRAKFADESGAAGVQGSLWLYPVDQKTSTVTNGPTEIDVAEHYSEYPSLVMPTLHAYLTLGPSTKNCAVAGNETGFHTYAVTWTPSKITFAYDGATCLSTATTGSSAHAFLLALTQTVGIGKNVPTAQTLFPATAEIDYVRVWK